MWLIVIVGIILVQREKSALNPVKTLQTILFRTQAVPYSAIPSRLRTNPVMSIRHGSWQLYICLKPYIRFSWHTIFSSIIINNHVYSLDRGTMCKRNLNKRLFRFLVKCSFTISKCRFLLSPKYVNMWYSRMLGRSKYLINEY